MTQMNNMLKGIFYISHPTPHSDVYVRCMLLKFSVQNPHHIIKVEKNLNAVEPETQ